MPDPRRHALILLALTGLPFALPASADDPCRRPLVASAEIAADPGSGGSGLGGTGLQGESGIGGTGLEGESGIGGTGLQVFGTITALGSICVNGLRIDYAPDVAVQIDGRRADAGALVVGEVVLLEATRGDGGLHTERVEIVHALVGTIERADADSGLLALLGHTVEVLPETRVAGDPERLLRVGSSVAISGLRRGEDHVVATRIAPAPPDVSRVGPRLGELIAGSGPGSHLSIEGYVSGRSDGRIRVDALPIDLTAAIRGSDVQPGERIRATGRLTPERVLRIAPPTRPELPRPTTPERRPDRPDRPPDFERPEPIERPEIFDRPDVAPRIESIR